MKATYDSDVDVLQIVFQEAPIAESDEDESGVIFDFDNSGNVVGIEVIAASTRINESHVRDSIRNQVQMNTETTAYPVYSADGAAFLRNLCDLIESNAQSLML